MNRFSKWIPLGAGALALGAMLICMACGTSSTAASKVTEMRVVHLSPDEQPLDLLIDNKVVFSSLAYGVPTGFNSITAVNHDLKLNLSGAPTNILDNPQETFTGNTSYTYLIVGTATSLRSNKLTDDHTKPDTGMFKLRVVNGSPNFGPVDVYVVKPGTDFNTTVVKPTIGGLASEAASTYQSLASGGYNIYITTPGDQTCLQVTPPTLPDCLINLDGRNGTAAPSFQAGQNRTLIMLNSVPLVQGGTPFTTLPILADLN